MFTDFRFSAAATKIQAAWRHSHRSPSDYVAVITYPDRVRFAECETCGVRGAEWAFAGGLCTNCMPEKQWCELHIDPQEAGRCIGYDYKYGNADWADYAADNFIDDPDYFD